MANIQFHSKGISFKVPNPKKTETWLNAVAQSEGRSIDFISYVFCSDKGLLLLNQEFLRHDTYTDIISFDLSEGVKIQGEIYISIPRVRENARIFNQPFDTELRRVLAHGLLHFLGYKDKTPSQKSEMRMKEEASLSLWK